MKVRNILYEWNTGKSSSFAPQKSDSYIHIDVEFGE